MIGPSSFAVLALMVARAAAQGDPYIGGYGSERRVLTVDDDYYGGYGGERRMLTLDGDYYGGYGGERRVLSVGWGEDEDDMQDDGMRYDDDWDAERRPGGYGGARRTLSLGGYGTERRVLGVDLAEEPDLFDEAGSDGGVGAARQVAGGGGARGLLSDGWYQMGGTASDGRYGDVEEAPETRRRPRRGRRMLAREAHGVGSAHVEEF